MSNKTKKTALCISGQPRFFEEGYKYLYENFIKINNPDVFIHCWFNRDNIGKEFDSADWNKGQTGKIEGNTEEKILKLYKPKACVFEPESYPNPAPISFDKYNKNLTHTTPKLLYSMFYSIMKSNELKKEHEKENNFKYDWVVRTRFDGALTNSIDLNGFDSNKLHCLNIIRNPNVICDWFNFSSSDNMDVFSDVYNKIYEYWNNDNVLMAGENLITHHLNKNGLEINKHNISYLLIRNGKPDYNFGRVF